MIATFLVAAALVSAPDTWDIKPNLADKSKSTISTTVEANMGSGDHVAKMNVVRTCGAASSDKTVKARYTWDALEVDGNSMDAGDNGWDVVLNPDGAILSTTAEGGDDIRRMLSATNFVYPTKAVGAGDKWSSIVKPNKDKDERQLTWSYEVKGIEKVKDVDALKVAATLSEKGSDPMSGDGTWWIGKDGTVLKFELKIKNWVVPMSGGELINATIKGEAAK